MNIENTHPPLSAPVEFKPERIGIVAALLAIFFGMAFGGPALARANARKRRLQAQAAAKVREARFRVREADRRVRRRTRRLGGGSI